MALLNANDLGTKVFAFGTFGEVAERLNAPDLKSGIEVTLSGVQIPPSPPTFLPQNNRFDINERPDAFLGELAAKTRLFYAAKGKTRLRSHHVVNKDHAAF